MAFEVRAAFFSVAVALAMTSACASKAPSHDGYPEALSEPWTEARPLELDERGEAEIVDSVSYPDRRRAHWYAVDLPAPGDLRGRLVPVTFGRDDPAELGFEIYDRELRLLKAGAAREPGDELTHGISELDPGPHYLHVYATERDGAADYTLRILYAPSGSAGSASFPDSVAFLDDLPAIPEVDDTPQRRPRRDRPRRRPREREPEPQAITARIAGITIIDAGTRIRVSRGERHGVSEGWKGRVTTQAGRPIPDGAFTVDRVTEREAFGTVSAPVDAVTSARHVRLEPP